MKCEDVRTRLDDYVDGEIDEAAFQEMELHLSGCGACRADEGALRALLGRASALPREMAPGRDLWPEVVARLRGGEGLRLLPRARWPRGAWPMALAAAAAVALAVSVSWSVRGRIRESGPFTGEVQPVSAPAAAAAILEAERTYARAGAELLAALDARKESVSPETRAALDENLKTIDDALAQVRAALRQDPGNAQLARLLTSTHRKKLDAIERVVRLNRL